MAAALYGQADSTVWDGVYNAAQATKGEAQYGAQCASCHGADLQGSGPMPGLTGDDFRKEWTGQTVGDLFDRIQTTMPGDKPGKLSPEVNADILAFLLKANGYPAGKGELTGNVAALSRIKFTQKR